MIFSLKKPILIVLRSLSETNNLMEVGFKVCAVMTDDHPPKVSAF